MKPFFPVAMAIACFALPASADIKVSFIEGAPKDRFVLVSDSGICADTPIAVTVDLKGSAGALIFDVSETGAGVEVFQPFELVSGGDHVTTAPEVTDGDTRITLELTGLPQGAEVSFTIDVDDTIGAREITVTDAEIEGAMLAVSVGDETSTAIFGGDAEAILPMATCAS